jgi:2-haloacid dehalogenase
MPITLAFDVYGTLIDTSGVNDLLKKYIEDKAERFMDLWRSKQLEYSFRRGLMKRHEKFSVCTRSALDYSDTYLNTGMT